MNKGEYKNNYNSIEYSINPYYCCCFFFFQSSGKNSIKAEHDRYLTLISKTHDFNAGLKGLETLDNDKGQEAFKNIKTEIKIVKELKNADSSLDNKDVNSAKKSIDKADSLTTDNSFDKAIEWLKEDITKYYSFFLN